MVEARAEGRRETCRPATGTVAVPNKKRGTLSS